MNLHKKNDINASAGLANKPSELQLASAVNKAKQSIVEQSQQIKLLAAQLNSAFKRAVSLIAGSDGRLIISGMGKSGHIGKKIAATMASTGTPAYFVHSGEAYHGDLGMFQPNDLVLLLSHSGETDEVLKLIPSLKNFGNKIISISGSENNTLARHSDVAILAKVDKEICPNNLAPTSSTTATLVMGDALAVALMNLRGFSPHHFALYHPGGSLGRKLLTQVKDVMHSQSLPFVDVSETMNNVIMTMTTSTLGLAIVTQNKALQGVITDGDLRRALVDQVDFSTTKAADLMTVNPVTIAHSAMLVDAEAMMREHHIKQMLVTENSTTVGVLEFFQS
jgi:arabinose-5-phosphate isomerase